jgi:hypothetical protein
MGHPFVVRLMPEEEEEGKKATRQQGNTAVTLMQRVIQEKLR